MTSYLKVCYIQEIIKKCFFQIFNTLFDVLSNLREFS